MHRTCDLLCVGTVVVGATLLCQPASAASTERVSVNSAEAQANGHSQMPAVNADGRFVAFTSNASNLVAGDANGHTDVFVRDRQTGTTQRVSVSSEEVEANSVSTGSAPAISADGRFVAFISFATNLVPDDTNGHGDIFVRDLVAGTTDRVSISSAEVEADDTSFHPALSADGRFVTFHSGAGNLITGDTNGWVTDDVFVRDRLNGTTERVSVASNGAGGNDNSQNGSISADGRFVAFSSNATNLVPGDRNGWWDIFVHDRVKRITERVSIATNRVEADLSSIGPYVSTDARFVVFFSNASNLVPRDTGYSDAFVRDRRKGTTEWVNVPIEGAERDGHTDLSSISGDGRFVAFHSDSSNLIPRDTNESNDVFLRDRQAGTIQRVSVARNGAQGNGQSLGGPAISSNGRFVAFASLSSNLVPGDTNNVLDIFVRDRGPQPDLRNDLLVDFGSRGLWQWLNNRDWLKINNSSPTSIGVADLDGDFDDEPVVALSTGGLWARYPGAWRKLHDATPKRFVSGDFDGNGTDDLAADLGNNGVWARINNASWTKWHAAITQSLAVGDLDGDGRADLIADFGNLGVWVRHNSTVGWAKLDSRSPTHLATGDLDGNGKDELIAANLGASGVFVRYNNAGAFQNREASTVQGLVTGDLDGNGKDELIADFGPAALRALYNNAAPWLRLDARDPTNAIAADLDSSGKDEVIADFGAAGLWARYNNSGAFRQFRASPSQAIAAGGFD